MADPVTITQTRSGGRVRIRLKFPLATEPARRVDAGGRARPQRFVRSVVVERGGTVVFSGHFGPYLARLPEVEFELDAAAQPGEFVLRWEDSLGKNYEQAFALEA